MCLAEQAPGGAGARRSKHGSDSRARVVAGHAAINAGLFAVLAPVVACRSLAFSSPANATLAVVVHLATEIIWTKGAVYTATIDAGLIVVLYAVTMRRKFAHSTCANAIKAVAPH